MSIKLKLILLISGTLIVIGFFMGAIIYWQNSKVLLEHTSADIDVSLNYTSQLVNFYVDRIKNNLTNLASDPLVTEALETNDKTKLNLLSEKLTILDENVSIIENIALMKVNGTACVAMVLNKDASSLIGRDFTDRDYCKGVIKTQQTYISSAYVSASSNVPVLGVVVPVKDKNGAMLGFVYGSLNLRELRGYLWDLQDNSKVELLDRYGTMFLSTQDKIEKLNDLTVTERDEIKKISESIKSNKTSSYFKEKDNFVGYKTDGVITIIFEKSASNLISLSDSLNLTVFISLIVAIVLTIIIVYFSVNSITKRISRLSKISKEITSGKFSIQMQEKDLLANDETAALAKAFNEMSKKLYDLYANLEKKVLDRTKEVDEKSKKLEELNKYMVGRELKMIELKEKLSKLENTIKK